jgi:hypothetical protein
MLDILLKESRALQHQISRRTVHLLPQQPRAPLTTTPPQRLLHGHHLLACPGGGKSANPTKRRVTVHKTPPKTRVLPAQETREFESRRSHLFHVSSRVKRVFDLDNNPRFPLSQRLWAPKEPTVPFSRRKTSSIQRIFSSGRLENSKNLRFSWKTQKRTMGSWAVLSFFD